MTFEAISGILTGLIPVMFLAIIFYAVYLGIRPTA